MTAEDNGNVAGLLKPTSSSNEDLSEYTDADESISAPTEFLAETEGLKSSYRQDLKLPLQTAECKSKMKLLSLSAVTSRYKSNFLSAVMLKDYVTALKYCKLILQYEPNNGTAKEFYPLILEKLHHTNTGDGSSNDNESEDEEASEGNSSSGTDSENNSSSEDSSGGQEEEEAGVEQIGADKQSKGSSDGNATTGSYSSLEDDDVDTMDQLVALAARYQIDNVNLGNGNKIYNTKLSNSTPMQNRSVPNKTVTGSVNAALGNPFQFGTSSDSESPTEPVSQQTVAMLRAKVVPKNF